MNKTDDEILEGKLEEMIELLQQMTMIVENFSEESKTPLQNRMYVDIVKEYNIAHVFPRRNALIQKFYEAEQISEKFKDMAIPYKALEAVDEGRNPSQFTLELLEDCDGKIADSAARTKALEIFLYYLKKGAKESFPKEYEYFTELQSQK